MSKDKMIGVRVEDTVEWHAAGIGPNDYDTMCGIDANDPQIGHYGTVQAKRGTKISCKQCRAMFEGFKSLRLRDSDFAVGA